VVAAFLCDRHLLRRQDAGGTLNAYTASAVVWESKSASSRINKRGARLLTSPAREDARPTG